MKSKNLENIRYALFKEGNNWLYSIKLNTGETFRGSGLTRQAVKNQSESIMKTIANQTGPEPQ